jgi:FLYWCH zinc finger domain
MINVVVSRRKDKTYWECVRRGKPHRCPAMITEHNGIFIRGSSRHIHAPSTGIHKTVCVTRNVRLQASAEMFAPGSAIVAEALRAENVDADNPIDNRATLDNLVNT